MLASDIRKAEASMQFLRTTYNPIVYNAAPPVTTSTRSSMIKDATIQCQFIIASNTLVGELIPVSTGMILWMMKFGIDCIYRMAFIPINAVSTYSSTTGLIGAVFNTSATTYTAAGATGGALAAGLADVNGILNTITYNQELAIPVGVATNGTSNIISVSTGTLNDIEFTRVYAGIVEAYSSTVSIGNTTLAGTFTAASIADTRDICQ